MQPEEKARIKINKQLMDAGWSIVSRNEYVPNTTAAVKEALMQVTIFFLLKTKQLLSLKQKRKPILSVKLSQSKPRDMRYIHRIGMVFGSLTKSLWCILQTGIKYISKIY